MKVVLVIERGALFLWGQIMTSDEEAKRSLLKLENLWKNILKEKDQSRSKSLDHRSTDEERSPSRKRWSKKSNKRHQSRSKKNKKKKHWRYSSSPSPSSSSNSDSDESKYWNNEGKESTDSRFRVVSEEDQYKYSLPPDMAQYANVNFDTYADLIKVVVFKIPVSRKYQSGKTLDDFVKDILREIKRSRRISISTMLLKEFKVEIDQLWVHCRNLDRSWVSQIIPRGFNGCWFKKNSEVCWTNCSAAETSIEFHFLL